ncbi:MAG: ribonuclease HI family protein [Elusimicrobiota bacterium]|jgi:ribonuclease HI|nr:ribonuclease HI family protein [Elusimicrobiota bacterium]
MDLIINIDGGSRGNPGPGASAWIIKDKTGKKLAAEGVFFALCTNNQAVFNALKMALLKAFALGGKRLEVRSDSLLLVKQYAGEYKIKNPELKVLMREIKALAAKFAVVRLSHVPRAQNKEADLMCNITMDNNLKKPADAAAPKPRPKKEPAQGELFDLSNL